MNELYNEILKTVNENKISASFIEPEEANRMIKGLFRIFNLDVNQLFVWEDFKGHIVFNKYGDKSKIWNASLDKFIFDFQNDIFVAVTNEEYYPWPILSCKKADIVSILNEQSYFEYFIFDSKMDKIIFDTHHNTLMRYSIGLSDSQWR